MLRTNVPAKSTSKKAIADKSSNEPQTKGGFLRDRIAAKRKVDDIEQVELGKAIEESVCDKDDLELLTTNEDVSDCTMFRESYFLTMTQNISLDATSAFGPSANSTQNPLTFESFAEVMSRYIFRPHNFTHNIHMNIHYCYE